MKIAVLISGRGSNMQAILDACARPDYPAECILVLSNRPDAKGLEYAENAGVPTKVLDHKGFLDREGFEVALQASDIRDFPLRATLLLGNTSSC